MINNRKAVKLSLIPLGLIYLIVFILWFLYRMFFRYPEEIDELVVKPLIWITPVLFINFLKKLSPVDIGLPKNLKNTLIATILIGTLLPLIQIFPKLISQGINTPREWNIFIFLIPLGTAFSEEYLFRGFFLKHLLSFFPSIISNLIVSFFFAIIHLPLMLFIHNNNNAGIILSRFYLLTISSFCFGYLYIKSKNIGPSVIAHFLNNLILVLI